MPAYVVITRERTRSAAQLGHYRQFAPASFERYSATFRAYHGRHEVLEGAASRTSSSPSFQAPKRQRLGIMLRPIRLRPSTASRERTTAAVSSTA
jgi:hypothetical protein